MKKILLYLLYKNMITSITYNPLICSFALRIKTEIPWHSLKEPHGLPLHTFSVLPQGRYITSCIPRSFPGPGFSSQRHQSCASFTITTSTTICSSTHLWDQKVKFASVERELLSFSFHTFCQSHRLCEATTAGTGLPHHHACALTNPSAPMSSLL